MSSHPGTIRPRRTDGDASEWGSSSEQLFIFVLSHSLIRTRTQTHTRTAKIHNRHTNPFSEIYTSTHTDTHTHRVHKEGLISTELTVLTFNINCQKPGLLQQVKRDFDNAAALKTLSCGGKNTKAGRIADTEKGTVDFDTDQKQGSTQFYAAHGNFLLQRHQHLCYHNNFFFFLSKCHLSSKKN